MPNARDLGLCPAGTRRVRLQPEGRAITGVHALETEALLQLRRGNLPQALAVLGELWTVAETCGMVHHVAPAACGLAEYAEQTGEWADAVAPLRNARDLALRLGLARVANETGYWLCRAGALDPAELGHPDPDELEVLALLREGLTDAEIARRLVLSVKTVNHHVSAVLDELGGGQLPRRGAPGRAHPPAHERE